MQDNIVALAIFMLALPFWFIGAVILKIFIYMKNEQHVRTTHKPEVVGQRAKARPPKVPYLGEDGLYDYRNEAKSTQAYKDTVEYIVERVKEGMMDG